MPIVSTSGRGGRGPASGVVRRLCDRGGESAVSPQGTRPGYDRWRDVDGAHVAVGCQVEQVTLATEHGAVSKRLGKRGVVVGRRGHRLWVCFDGEDRTVTVRPFVVRVVGDSASAR